MKSRPPTASIFIAAVLLALYLPACNLDLTEEASAQALIEETAKSNTPTPAQQPVTTLSAIAMPTAGSPIPAIETAIPPTDTPIPPTTSPTLPPPTPTDTPVPPTPTKITGAFYQDDSRDTMLCDSNASVRDFEVDITQIMLQQTDGSLLVQVRMFRPLDNDYSFALAIYLVGIQEQRSYLWEIHEGAYRIGEMDGANFELIEPAEPATIDQNPRTGVFSFLIPIASLTETNFQFGARSFHTAEAGAAKSCDVAGMFQIPAELFEVGP